VHVVGISGSLSPSSANSALLDVVRRAAEPATVVIWRSLDEVPPFRPEDDGDEVVASLREAIAVADVVVIATPEYAGGMPGVLKNALDWLVGSGELYGRRVLVVSAAPAAERGANARRWVEDVVRMQGARVIGSFTVAVPRDDAVAVERAAHEVLRAIAEIAV
jgi:NAD(P)H-dependent FMN reductase